MMNRKGAEAQRLNRLSEIVIGACIEIHQSLGPGLLESAYDECLAYELSMNKLDVNFNVALLKNGLKRIVNNFPEFSESPRLCASAV